MVLTKLLRSLPLLLALLALGCDAHQQEEAARLTVRSLIAAPPEVLGQELKKVVALGRFVLPDIEQEFHSADTEGRLRLLAALEQLALPEARPFLQVVARWGRSAEERQQAARLAGR